MSIAYLATTWIHLSFLPCFSHNTPEANSKQQAQTMEAIKRTCRALML